MFKKISSALASLAIVLVPAIASAHVVVTPGTANVGEELVFTVSVPNERDTPVTFVKLLIPAGVTDVTPTSKDGWTITAPTTGSGEDATTTSIMWTDGAIPVGQRQDFSFSAQVPGKAGELDWKAYQTYGDGTIVHWDQTPAGSDDATGNAGPYSVTTVANDLTGAKSTDTSSTNNILPLVISLVALIVAVSSVLFRKK